MVDEQKLRQLAEAATPGEWHWDSDTIKGDPLDRVRFRVVTTGRTITQCYYSSSDDMAQKEAEWIATANPASILSLLDELQTLREERTAWRVTAENAEAAVKQARDDAQRFASALVSVMDCMKDHDIQGETGLPDEECKQIADTRRAAIESLKGTP